MNHAAHLIVHLDYLVNTLTAPIALVSTGITTVGPVNRRAFIAAAQHLRLIVVRRVWAPTRFTEYTNQSLGQQSHNTIGEQIGLHTHVGEPGQRANCRVCVNRGQHQVSRKTRLDRYICRFVVPDLTDHHHVWILSLYGA